jgi:hypothetical protein
MSEQYRTLLSFMRDNEGGALFFYGIQERDKKNTTRTAVVDDQAITLKTPPPPGSNLATPATKPKNAAGLSSPNVHGVDTTDDDVPF